MVDLPGERRSHAEPTPRGGGVGIAAVGLVTLSWLGARADAFWWSAALGLLLVCLAGWWDDHRPLSPWPRLAAHVVAGLCLAFTLAFQDVDLITVIAAFVLVPVLVNIWNFMDGIDGLAASQAMLCALGFGALVADEWRILALVVSAACAGFLPFNLARRKIFLGDVGSGAAGYLLATLLAGSMSTTSKYVWPALLLLPSAFLVDSSLTLFRRMKAGEAWWRPHVQHLYQRWSRKSGHLHVTAAYAGWTVLAIGIMLLLSGATFPIAITGAMIAFLVAGYTWWRLGRHVT